LDEDGREAHRRFVEQHDIGVEHHGAGHREHLLFATEQGAGKWLAPLLQARETPLRSRSAFTSSLHKRG